MRTRLPVLGIALLITLTACGDKQVKVVGETKDDVKVAAQANGSPSPDQQKPKQGQQPPVRDSRGGNKTDQMIGTKNSVRKSSPIPSPIFKNTLPMETELTPICGSHGTLMMLKIQTRKGASISIAVGYSSGDSYGNYLTGGRANDQGRFTYTWVIPPEAPMGNARVVVGAADRSAGPDEYSAFSTGEAATELVPFRVAISC